MGSTDYFNVKKLTADSSIRRYLEYAVARSSKSADVVSVRDSDDDIGDEKSTASSEDPSKVLVFAPFIGNKLAEHNQNI